MKSVEETTLLTRLEELVAMGKKKKSVLEYKEVMDHLADLDLDPDRIDRIYEYLETQGIDILGNLDAEEEVEKDLDLTLPEGINIDDPVRMYPVSYTHLVCLWRLSHSPALSRNGVCAGAWAGLCPLSW